MLYQGGKARLAKYIVPEIEKRRTSASQVYYEPFLGGCNILPHVSGRRIGSDNLLDLILLYRAIQDGWIPPVDVTRELYASLRHAEPSALRGFVGCACSFYGKWFGGYFNKTLYKPGSISYGKKVMSTKAENGRNSLMKIAHKIKDAIFIHCPYDELDIKEGSLVYCDPPYFKTTGYRGECFDHHRFWAWVRGVSVHSTVLVSSYNAPFDFVSVWEKEIAVGLGNIRLKKARRKVERLYMHCEQEGL